MNRARSTLLASSLALLIAAPASGDDPAPVSFLKDVAPILVQNCIACHNPKKSESKYVMTTFAQLAKGGALGKGITLTPGDPDASYLVELCRPDGEPRMPYKQEPLARGKLEVLERWVKEGAKYDGAAPSEDWPAALRKATPIIARLRPGRCRACRVGLPRGHDLEDRRRRRFTPARWDVRADSRDRLQPGRQVDGDGQR